MFARFQKLTLKHFAKRFNSTSAKKKVKKNSKKSNGALAYARGISLIHWTMAGGILTTFGFVELAKRTPKDDPRKRTYMNFHKSFGLLMGALVLGRISRRFIFVNRIAHIPGKMPGPLILHQLGNLSHYSMYGFMIFMPVTGILMGYYSGNGLPFFNFKIKGANKENQNKDIAKNSYKYHKIVGKIFEIAVGIHISASLFHHVQGHKPFSRMNPFMSSSAGISAFFFESIEDGYIVNKNDELDELELGLDDNHLYRGNNNNSNHWTNELSKNENNKEIQNQTVNQQKEIKLNESHLNIIFGTDMKAAKKVETEK